MIAIAPETVSAIDRYAEDILHIPVYRLMKQAGHALALSVRAALPKGGTVLFLCGGGNNGGDGYAAAVELLRSGIRAIAADVTGRGQASEAGRAFLEEYRKEAGDPLDREAAIHRDADVLVDAILGTGARLPLGEELAGISAFIRAHRAYKIAADLPLGVDAAFGRVDPLAVTVDETVCFGFLKQGLFSYPARAFCGRITCRDIGLAQSEVITHFALSDRLTDKADIPALLPVRPVDSHKGTYGHLLMLCGSPRYRGAAILAATAAVRMGAGLVTLAAPEEVLAAAVTVCPEVICARMDTPKAEALLPLAEGKSAILIGPGVIADEALLSCLDALLKTEGCPLILDAGALGALAAYESVLLLKGAKRKVILTPHPGEFSRLVSLDTQRVQAERLPLALSFCAENPVTLVLKGAASIVAEGARFALNLTGSPSLAKGGSGDVLAGALASLIASGMPPYEAARLAVFLHGAAGERLCARYSPIGVRPADLADAMAEILGEVYR